MLALPAAAASARDNAPQPPPSSDNVVMAPARQGDAAASPAQDNAMTGCLLSADLAKERARRAVWRKVAAASLLSILLLIIFTVFVMIYSRRMRIRYLGYYRRIRFSRIWDVWWQKPEKRPGGRDKPPRP